MNKRNKTSNTAEKAAAMLSIALVIISLLLDYREYALGLSLAAPIAWLLYRWQMLAVANLEGLPPRKATIRLVARSGLRFFVFLGMAGLSSLGGLEFFFGVLTGLFLQIIAFIGKAIFIFIGKEG